MKTPEAAGEYTRTKGLVRRVSEVKYVTVIVREVVTDWFYLHGQVVGEIPRQPAAVQRSKRALLVLRSAQV